jgi:hypothetical protein
MTRNILRGAGLLAVAGLVTVAGGASAQQTVPVLHVGAAEITVGGRAQTQFTTSSVDTVPMQEWVMRRLRLETVLKVNDLVGGKIQLDFAGNKVAMKDAYISLDFDPALRLLVGNAHRPFGIMTQTTSNRILPIERGTRIRGLPEAWEEQNLVTELGYSDRDLGMHVLGAPHGAPLGLFYAASYTNGPARKPTVHDDTYQLSARVGVHPTHTTTLAASWSRRDFAQGDSTNAGVAWAMDGEIGHYGPGFHLVTEAAYGDFDPAAGAHFFGAHVWLGYRTRELHSKIRNLEPMLRVSHGDPDVESDIDVAEGGTLITPGLNLYLGGLNRVMINYDLWRQDDGSRENSFKMQFQLAF